jgi:hypothetical protein
MADEAPKPFDDAPGKPDPTPPPPSPELRKARREARRERFRQAPAKKKASLGEIVVGSFCITAVTGCVLAIVLPSMLSSQGARRSVRIEWERRNAELDAMVERARAEGKLPRELPRD